MTKHTPVDVASKIRAAAAEKRKSQGDLATILGTSRMAVSRRLNGHTSFTAEELSKLAEGLDVPVGQFFGEVPA